MAAVLIALFLLAPDLSARRPGPLKEKKRPGACTSIDPCQFTSPAITLLRPDPDDTCLNAEPAEVWFDCRVDSNGKAENLKLIWCSSRDTSYVVTARTVVQAMEFSTEWPGKYARGKRLRHVVYFRTEQKDVCELGETPDSLDYTLIDEFPVMTFEQKPAYPYLALKNRLTGTAWVKCLVNIYGEVDEAWIHRSSYVPLLDNAALLAAYNNKFLPARINKKPVPIWVTYKVEFKSSN